MSHGDVMTSDPQYIPVLYNNTNTYHSMVLLSLETVNDLFEDIIGSMTDS